MARLTSISLAETDFDADAAARTFRTGVEDAGAIVSFLGQVSAESSDNPVTALHLDHMPEATLASIEKIADAAEARWPLLKASIIHRVGTVKPANRLCSLPAPLGIDATLLKRQII